MDRRDVDWTGYIPAITTPFDRDGAVAWDDLATQLEWLVDERMHGLVLAGTSGEWFSLTADERAQLFVEAARTVAGRVWLLGGCNAFTAREAIAHAHAAARAGLDGILLTPPPYVVPSPREIVAFYREVSDAVDLPICLYNWPRGCVVDMGADLLAELAELDNVVALKNSTGDLAAFLESLYALGDRLRCFGTPTSPLGIDLSMAGRGDGLMGAGGVLGSDHPDFWRALQAGDLERARELGRRDQLLMRRWYAPDYGGRLGSAQAVLKTALRLRGVPAGYVRRPLLELTPEAAAAVEATLRELEIDLAPVG